MKNYSLTLDSDGFGRISIGSFTERFESSLSYWTKSDYLRHWELASEKLHNGEAVSFITFITEPSTSNFVRAWVCYPQSDELVFQEHILFLDAPDFEINFLEPHKNVRSYECETQDGDKVSEWRIQI